jgi:hypothetical protein
MNDDADVASFNENGCLLVAESGTMIRLMKK